MSAILILWGYVTLQEASCTDKTEVRSLKDSRTVITTEVDLYPDEVIFYSKAFKTPCEL